MKIAVFYGSGRREGNSAFIAKKVLEGAGSPQDIQDFYLAYTDIKPCLGCFSCRERGVCVHKDEMERILEAIRWADAMVLSVPIYTFQLAGQVKTFMDRMYPLLSGPPGQYVQTITKDAVLVVTQGAPDPYAFKSCIESTSAALGMYGIHVKDVIVCGGSNMIGSAEKNSLACEHAVSAGKQLAETYASK